MSISLNTLSEDSQNNPQETASENYQWMQDRLSGYISRRLAEQQREVRPTGRPILNGVHTISHASGDTSHCSFVNGLKHGPTTMIQANGTCHFSTYVNGRLSGPVTIYIPNISIYTGETLNNLPHGNGSMISYQTSTRFDGEFEKGAFDGIGTVTYPDGSSFRANFESWIPHTTLHHMESPVFLGLLLGKFPFGGMSGFSIGIISEFLEQIGHLKQAQSLRSAIHWLKETKRDSKKTAKDLLDKLYANDSQLLLYGSKNHAMGLELSLSQSKTHIFFDLFNSGDGLKYHNQNPEGKYQTMKRFQIPIESINPSHLQLILNSDLFSDTDFSYALIRAIPAAREVAFPENEGIWQTQQKFKNCSLEWIFAYLKNSLGRLEYTKMRLKLFEYCRNLTNTLPWASEETKVELDRKISKRRLKISAMEETPLKIN